MLRRLFSPGSRFTTPRTLAPPNDASLCTVEQPKFESLPANFGRKVAATGRRCPHLRLLAGLTATVALVPRAP